MCALSSCVMLMYDLCMLASVDAGCYSVIYSNPCAHHACIAGREPAIFFTFSFFCNINECLPGHYITPRAPRAT